MMSLILIGLAPNKDSTQTFMDKSRLFQGELFFLAKEAFLEFDKNNTGSIANTVCARRVHRFNGKNSYKGADIGAEISRPQPH